MEQLVKFILSTAGLTWILCESVLFKRLREKITDVHNTLNASSNGIKKFLSKILWVPRQLFKCPGCMGFWVGIACYYLVYVWGMDAVVYPFISTIGCYVIVNYGKYLERKN